jgi:hypothetical protein
MTGWKEFKDELNDLIIDTFFWAMVSQANDEIIGKSLNSAC